MILIIGEEKKIVPFLVRFWKKSLSLWQRVVGDAAVADDDACPVWSSQEEMDPSAALCLPVDSSRILNK